MMTVFLRLLNSKAPQAELLDAALKHREGLDDPRKSLIDPKIFSVIPGTPFSYWVGEGIRKSFGSMPIYDCETEGRSTRCGISTLDNFRFLRLSWEISNAASGWKHYFNGGKFSPFYDNFSLLICWGHDGQQVKSFVEKKVGSASRKVQGEDKYFKSGFVFPRRTKAFSPKFMNAGGIFSTAGQAGFCNQEDLPWTIALMSSRVVNCLISLSQGGSSAPQFEVGLIKRLPWPQENPYRERLNALALNARNCKYILDSVNETSYAFVLPAALRSRAGSYDVLSLEAELEKIQVEIDDIAFDLYGFSKEDREEVISYNLYDQLAVVDADDDDYFEGEDNVDINSFDAVISWAVGVAFNRFDWRLAIGVRQAPSLTDPFALLPTKSPGMLPDSSVGFRPHFGFLVDDNASPHDFARLVDEVLETVNVDIPGDTRRWLQRDFFTFHLKLYSKSRRKAPIYWPLSTSSGNYTLWLYYPSLNDQSLFIAVNDFVDPKLENVRKDLETLRGKGVSRTKQEEKDLEVLSGLEHELADLRDSLLDIAPNYRPNHDDGVQISAAPLWKLFRHKPWQKVLKDTWAKLEKGDYDWAHLAMNYWPVRVRDNCITDKSLAIAHNLEHLYIEPEPKPANGRGRAKKQDA